MLGVGLGIAGFLAVARVLARFVFGVSPTDPGTFAAVSTLLVAVSVCASLVPAYRATTVDPIKTLRDD